MDRIVHTSTRFELVGSSRRQKCGQKCGELGPKGGEQGGKILFVGTPAELVKATNSVTAPYLKEKEIRIKR